MVLLEILIKKKYYKSPYYNHQYSALQGISSLLTRPHNKLFAFIITFS